jgi:hypothetical protein
VPRTTPTCLFKRRYRKDQVSGIDLLEAPADVAKQVKRRAPYETTRQCLPQLLKNGAFDGRREV